MGLINGDLTGLILFFQLFITTKINHIFMMVNGDGLWLSLIGKL